MSLTNEQGYTTSKLPSNPSVRDSSEQKNKYAISKISIDLRDYPEEIRSIMETVTAMADDSMAKSVIMLLARLYTVEKVHCGELLEANNKKMAEWTEKQDKRVTELTEKTEAAIEKLNTKVNSSTAENKRQVDRALADSSLSREDLKTTIVEGKNFQSQISGEISEMITTMGNDLTDHFKCEMSSPIEETKEEFKGLRKVLKKRHDDIEKEGKLQSAIRLVNVIVLGAVFVMQIISLIV